ncbi:MAG: hypothetical protein HW419_739 [Deltaproteobacteria bacterium]|nr:hypothetical protein [Deltaproteobacteria bacterium]
MSLEQALTYSMPLEVYLQAAIVRGVLVTNQGRLSNFLVLREGEEIFSLKDATLEGVNRKPITVAAEEYLVYMREVFLIADLSPAGQTQRAGIESFYVQKEASKALFSVGPYLLQGSIYLVPGAALHDLLVEKSRFIPVTDATLVDRPEIAPRTYLINRNRIGFMTAIGDGLVEL